tara:strand:- start:72 stop:575 length:504 start_codon:yes stop_codon:yes gene_type:complete
MINFGFLLVLYIAFSRLLELFVSYRNTKQLLKLGAKEHFAFHYYWLVFFHIIVNIYFLIKSFNVDINFSLSFIIFIILQFLRLKVHIDMGKYWTTRIIVLENQPLVNHGLFKHIKHPNYLIVILEIFFLCLIFNDVFGLFVFSTINILLILLRISYEEKANKNRGRF